MPPKSGKTFVRPVGRRDFIKLGLAAGSVLIASCSRSHATATDTPIASPTIEIEPLPIEFAAYTELDMSEQSNLLATLPEDRPALSEDGLHDMAGLKLSNSLQEETIAFIIYEIDPKDGYTVVLDTTNEKVNYRQSAVMYIEEIDGQGNRSWVKLFGLTVNKLDQHGKIIERQTTWFKPGPEDVDLNNKTVSINDAESVLSYKTTASDGVTQMFFTPLFPKNYLAGMPDTSTTPLPVNLPGVAADKMVTIEATQPEYVFPREIDQIYYDEIERMSYKWKFDDGGNVWINFGNFNTYFKDRVADDGFVLAFVKSKDGYKTNAFIHQADKIGTTDTEGFADSLKERGRGGENVFKTQSDGTFGFIAMSTGAVIEKTVQTENNGEAKVIEAVFVCVDKDDVLTYQSVITGVSYSDGLYKIGIGRRTKEPQTVKDLQEYLVQGKMLELFVDYIGRDTFNPGTSFHRYAQDFAIPFVSYAKRMLDSKTFSEGRITIPAVSQGTAN